MSWPASWSKRVLLAVAGLLVVAPVAAAATATIAVRRSFPEVEGEVEVAGLDGEVTVSRDARGVPTITADTSDDLFRAQGYVHAQDRFWEMDFRRHTTAGRLAELFGPDQLATDRFVRTLGWRRVAEAELDLLDEETIAMLEAYAEGVNAWMDGRTGSALSLEHALLPVTGAGGYEPEAWTPADSVAWLKAMAWDLRSNLRAELERGRLAPLDLGDGRDWQDLYPPYPEDRHAPILPDSLLAQVRDGDPGDAGAGGNAAGGTFSPTPASVGGALADAGEALDASPALLGDGRTPGLGSNSWVIGPERSATGAPLLANDPHLGSSLPSVWYQVGLRCREVTDDCPYEVTGFSFSGMPGVVIGTNAEVAWGFTNLAPDVTDLYVERIRDGEYATEDGWEPIETRQETFEVAGGEPVTETVRSTRHGPLLSDVDEAAAEIAADGEVATADEARVRHEVALAWTALEPRPTLDAIIGFMQADDWDSFRDAAADFEVPSQNLVYADREGHIGYQAPGRIPVRERGDGTVPVPGWTGEYAWEGYLDFDELPSVLDPDEGAIVTANQAVLPRGVEPFLTADPDPGYRSQRIRELLGDRDELTLDGLAAIQNDAHNANAEVLVPLLVDLDLSEAADASGEGDEGELARDAQQLLVDWDRQDDASSAAAAVFNATWRHLLARTFHDELPDFAHPSGGSRWWEVVRDLVEQPDAAWWDDLDTPEREERDEVLAAAMLDAVDELTDRFGDDPDAWRWGELHTLELTHPTFGASGIAPVEEIFNRGPLETSGGTSIVNATGWDAAEGYQVGVVPSMRMLVDLGDLDASRWANHTGASGRPFHPHYTDQADAWRDGETYPLPFTDEAVEDAMVDRLVLTPDG